MDESMAHTNPVEAPLFAQVSFHLIISDGLLPDLVQEVSIWKRLFMRRVTDSSRVATTHS